MLRHRQSTHWWIPCRFLRRLKKEAPKIVLMSATVDAAPLKDYFGGDAAVIDVPGRTFPVAVKFLEDAASKGASSAVVLGRLPAMARRFDGGEAGPGGTSRPLR